MSGPAAADRMKLYRAQLALLDQIERVKPLDPDAARYLVRAVNCLRARLGVQPLDDEIAGAVAEAVAAELTDTVGPRL